MELSFYKCSKCGKIVALIKGSACPTMCCGEEMKLIVPGSTDAAVEKHVPVVEVNGSVVTVKVGEVDHPMLPEHYIEWIGLETAQGFAMKDLKAGDAPCVTFALSEGDSVTAAYAYCNLHGLWKK
ncbi:desulfoferrodoxin family protein [Butyrivibrio sp. MC2013]|uniref:desulfoferrodoxin family protein n=1 Tax=Butyrivibrio sp. MC2013 TaxID=1280686 RepID=UPI00041448F1|nr:desulfoferrodoxin family protein [Butyrivibrio sp. MC2013]